MSPRRLAAAIAVRPFDAMATHGCFG